MSKYIKDKESGHTENKTLLIFISRKKTGEKTSEFVVELHFFISNTFISNVRLKLAKNQAKLGSNLRLNFGYLKIIDILHPCCHPKIIEHTLKNKQKNSCVCIHEIIPLIITKMKMRKKNGSHTYNINRPRSRPGHKYSKHKTCLSTICFYVLSNT